MKQYIYYSDAQRAAVISSLKTNDKRIDMLWRKALVSYDESKRAIGKKKLKHGDAQRKYRNWIMNVALKFYTTQDPTTRKKRMVSASFTEFWDYLHWFLKIKIPLDGASKWNEMENFFHQTVNEFPDELNKKPEKKNKK